MTLKWSSTPGDMILSPTADPLYNTNSFPSLDLQFATTKTLNDEVSGTPLVSHQRDMSGSNGAGTFVNSNGLIEESRTNNFLYSVDLGSPAWTPLNATVTNNVLTAPNGLTEAVELESSGAAVSQRIGHSGITGTITISIFAKAGTARYLQLLHSENAQFYANFDLQTGTKGTFGSASTSTIEPYGNGWYRCILTVTATIAGNCFFYITSSDSSIYGSAYAAQVDSLYLWGAQLETGSTATTYIPTTNVPSAAPRFDHDPVTGASLGLLVEESRTNLVLYSDFSTGWSLNEVTLNPDNSVTAPDGTTATYKVEETAFTSFHYATIGVNLGAFATAVSVFMKAGERTQGSIFLTQGGNNGAVFDLANGTVSSVSGAGNTALIEDYGNGWYRCTVVNDGAADIANSVRFGPNNGSLVSYAGTAGSGIYIWGAQVELGSFPTSYIPTSGSTVTRAADLAEITGTNFSSWYNQSEGTVFVSGTTGPGGFGSLFLIDNGTTGNQWSGSFDQTSTYSGSWIRTGGITQADLYNLEPVGTNETFKFAASATTNDAKYFTNGTQKGSDTSVIMPINTQMYIGRDRINQYGTEHISRVTYYPYRLPDAKLQTITS